jgi:membrane-associated phospholipid phosphatase
MNSAATRHTVVLCLSICPLTASAQTVARPDHLGDVLRLALPVAAAGWSLYQEDIAGLKEFGMSLAASEITTESVKRAVHDPRPTGSGKGFVSGHASTAFVSAGYLHQRYGVAAAIPAYALATVVAYRRVQTEHHFPRQVLGGAAIGLASAILFTNPRNQVQVAIVPTRGGLAFNYAKRW